MKLCHSGSGLSNAFPYSMTIWKNVPSLSEAFVDLFEERLRDRLSAGSQKPIGLATGRTMIPIYRSLVHRLSLWPTIDLEQLRLSWLSFNLDEYVGLAETDTSSFNRYMAQHLGLPLMLSPSRMKIPNGLARDLQNECYAYVNQLQQYGGLGVLLLGLGSNGHVGFNDPPCGPESSCRVVPLALATRKQNAFSFGGNPDSVPIEAITLGISEILKAEEIHLVVTGLPKADILNALLTSSCTNELPVSWLRMHQRVFIWADKDALSSFIGKN